MSDVFFSHNSDDKLAVEEIARCLRKVVKHGWINGI